MLDSAVLKWYNDNMINHTNIVFFPYQTNKYTEDPPNDESKYNYLIF